jgi:hypothetical protein
MVNRHDYKSICKEFPELGQIDTGRKAHFADLVRFNLLARYGGVWADSTVLCAVGLDSWLPLVQVGSPFFVFSNPGPDRLISNWFIVSTNSSTAIKEWRDAATGHFASRWTYKTYYSVHYLFQWRAKTQKKVKDEFKSMAKVSAVGPLTLEVAAQRGFMNCSEADLIRASPVHKLSRKSSVTIEEYERLLQQVKRRENG